MRFPNVIEKCYDLSSKGPNIALHVTNSLLQSRIFVTVINSRSARSVTYQYTVTLLSTFQQCRQSLLSLQICIISVVEALLPL